MDKSEQRLGTERLGKLLLQFTLPALIGLMVISTYSILDRIFIGRIVGSLALSGISVTFPISLLIMAFGMLIGIGAGASISIKLGQQKREDAEHILGNALSLIVIISLILILVNVFFLKNILQIFGASDDIIIYAGDFISIIMYGSLFQFITFGLNNSISATGHPKISMLTMLLSAILNILFLIIFVYYLGWGVKGSALATVTAQFFSAIWVLKHFMSKNANVKLKLKNTILNATIVKRILLIGISPFTLQLGASLVTLLFNISLAKYGGDKAIAAMGIIYSIVFFNIVPIIAITQGAQPIIGFNFGAGNIERVKKTVLFSILTASVISVIGFIGIQLFPQFLIQLFTKDANLISIGTHGIRIYMIMLPVIGFQIISANFFLAIGQGIKSMLLNLLRQVVILIPLVLILPNFFGLNGIWISGPISDFLASIVTFIFLMREIKGLDKKIQK